MERNTWRATRESIEVRLDWATLTSELVFTLDGSSPGLGALIFDLEFPNADMASVEDWFVVGNGTAEFIYVMTDVQLQTPLEAVGAAVPVGGWPLTAIVAISIIISGSMRLRRA